MMIFDHFVCRIRSKLFDRVSRVLNAVTRGLLTIRLENYIVFEIFFVNTWLYDKFGKQIALCEKLEFD